MDAELNSGARFKWVTNFCSLLTGLSLLCICALLSPLGNVGAGVERGSLMYIHAVGTV